MLKKGDTIGARFSAGKTNGFDYQRLVLAILVMLWHSWAVVYGGRVSSPEWYKLFMRAVLPLFFSLSGFLVASSLERTADLKVFGLLRALRIFPALCVEILLSALILGPLLTTVALQAYFSDPMFWRYLLNAVGFIHYDLPGVFRDNPVTWVNRSLWTVPFELECYILLALLYLMGFYRRTWLLVAALFALCAFCFFYYRSYSYDANPLVPGRLLIAYFLAGNVVYKLREKLPGGALVAVALVGLSYLMVTNLALTMLSPLVVAYASAAIGCTMPRKLPIVFGGDYSYGLYLYAFPMQQMVYTLLPGLGVWGNFGSALLVTSAFAAFSWHVIEKPTLSLRKRLAPLVASKPKSNTQVSLPAEARGATASD